MLKEAISKFGTVEEGNKDSSMKESFIVTLSGLNQEGIKVNVTMDNSDLVTISNTSNPISVNAEKLAFLGELFDEEYTIVVEDDEYVYRVHTKGTYFPGLYLEDIKLFYSKMIEKFGSI